MSLTSPSAKPTTGNGPLDISLELFSDSLKWVKDAVKDIPEARMTEQPAGVVNHPAWTLGHLNVSAGWLLTLLDEQCPDFDPAEGTKFGPGSKPVNDPKAHAPTATVLAQLTQRHALLDAAIRAKHATHFNRPAPEELQKFAPTLGAIAMYLITAHENYHLGQVMVWRRAAGLMQ